MKKRLEKLCLSLILFGYIIWNISIASNRNLPGVQIISREERWADEESRMRSTPRSTPSSDIKTPEQIESARISSIRNSWMNKYYPNDWKYESSITWIWNKYWIYPDYFNHNKTKIIIHHTASDYDPKRTKADVIKQIQLMYKYHTFDRDFWDIWYNFIIDQLWNIYEWRHWWEWAVWMHASNNNASSIGISLMWNFETDTPTEAQLRALLNLTTALAKYYHINPNWTTYTFQTNTTKEPYVTAKKNPTILWHKDITSTACPGKNLYTLLPSIRDEVSFRLSNNIIWDTPISNIFIKSSVKNNNTSLSNSKQSNNFSERLSEIMQSDSELFKTAWKKVKERYKWDLTEISQKSEKLIKKYSINNVKKLLAQNISVLLYELTTQYTYFDISCDNTCIFNIDWKTYNWTWASISFSSEWILIEANSPLSANKISIESSNDNWIVRINNYNRKSYAWIPWNEFKWKIIFKKWEYSLKNWSTNQFWFIVVNDLPFTEYMKWIVETNDTETLEKNKVMALIAKNYALFYLWWDNKHPNITSSDYTAIDDPEFFQKYVWAWLEKTLTKRYKALEETQNEIIMYNNYLPILPYFSCSAGFTLSAEEKRWRIDTPYLQTTIDFWACKDFIWHWVWLAWQWAEYLAKKWASYDQIIMYYYNWVDIEKL